MVLTLRINSGFGFMFGSLWHFVVTVAFCNKTAAFRSEKADAFSNKLLSHFVKKTAVVFCNNVCHIL